VIVDLEALACLECSATAREDHNEAGSPSRSPGPVNAQSTQLLGSVARQLQLTPLGLADVKSPPSQAALPAKQTADCIRRVETDPTGQKSEPGACTSNGGALEEPGPGSLAPIQEEPNTLTRAIVEQARVRIKDLLSERVPHNPAGPPTGDVQYSIGQPRVEASAAPKLLSGSEPDQIASGSTTKTTEHPDARRLVAEPPRPRRTALAAPALRAVESVESGRTSSVPPAYRRTPVRVAAGLALLSLTFLGFRHFRSHTETEHSHRTVAGAALGQKRANDWLSTERLGAYAVRLKRHLANEEHLAIGFAYALAFIGRKELIPVVPDLILRLTLQGFGEGRIQPAELAIFRNPRYTTVHMINRHVLRIQFVAERLFGGAEPDVTQ
jgi:hypothetical protein